MRANFSPSRNGRLAAPDCRRSAILLAPQDDREIGARPPALLPAKALSPPAKVTLTDAGVIGLERPPGDRSSQWMLSIDSTWHDPADNAINVAYTRAFWDAAAPFSNGQTYFNFPGLLEEGDAAVRARYGANHIRLARIKAAYDPDSRFRLNQDIRPARV